MQKLQMKMIPQECYQPFQELNIIDDLSRIIFEYSIDWKVFITFYDKQVLCHQFKNMNQKFIELDLSQIVFPPWNWAYYMIYDITNSSIYGFCAKKIKFRDFFIKIEIFIIL